MVHWPGTQTLSVLQFVHPVHRRDANIRSSNHVPTTLPNPPRDPYGHNPPYRKHASPSGPKTMRTRKRTPRPTHRSPPQTRDDLPRRNRPNCESGRPRHPNIHLPNEPSHRACGPTTAPDTHTTKHAGHRTADPYPDGTTTPTANFRGCTEHPMTTNDSNDPTPTGSTPQGSTEISPADLDSGPPTDTTPRQPARHPASSP
jgi:hypothetical protein